MSTLARPATPQHNLAQSLNSYADGMPSSAPARLLVLILTAAGSGRRLLHSPLPVHVLAPLGAQRQPPVRRLQQAVGTGMF